MLFRFHNQTTRYWYWFGASDACGGLFGVAHQIVVEKHQGKITCQSELNRGTEFVLALPTAGIA
ncbi:hypothetical protein LC586_13770 [Nostoc sp. CHAB 5714]|uniref:Histidine kinase n=1 Tax=Nostoc favosum CHAB5714 TaxID=2780399 RepID=A0ABS8I7V8_9NOSO|nr:hypothetical protein [Nostoc favosum]MCC5600265.1 hypothetical protein [Nostoc favosum CHAB5714]